MTANSKIEWTDATWTPIRARFWEIQSDGSGKERIGWHCEHASEGCRFCYAEALNIRLGTGLEFKPGHLYREEHKDRHNGAVKVFLDKKMLRAPLVWMKPRMIFVCSMTDLFADFVLDEWIDKLMVVMALCPQHTFQVLTKRPARMREYLSRTETPFHRIHTAAAATVDGYATWGWVRKNKIGATPYNLYLKAPWPLPNVWFGTSVEDQNNADERIPHLLQTPAAVRFVSAEPLLGPIDLHGLNLGTDRPSNALRGVQCVPDNTTTKGYHNESTAKLDWVIVGGESGRKARPFHLEWADAIVGQCKAAQVACFVKQLGAAPMSSGYPHQLHDRKGGDPAEWPARLFVREMPERAA